MHDLAPTVTLTVALTLPRRTFEWFETMATSAFTTVERMVGDIASECVRDYDKPVYDARAVENMTEPELEAALFDMELELDLRARLKRDEERRARRRQSARAPTHARPGSVT